MNKRSLILALVTTAVAGVLAAKHLRRHETPALRIAPEGQQAGPALYLFLDDRDHDAGCERVYAAFETAKTELPPGYDARRIDVELEPGLAEKFGVRMLPTILLVGSGGAVTGRVEGEGDEAQSKLRELVSRIPRSR